ncbi:NAD(P)-binding domain-containing protein [Kineococcus sp. T13]|uniref:NADPH-dependent F420 reductase n=1 Tax=Kineococcus vitellinus TaxID=2696565 RepID=UPI001412D6A4|nr:NAD(P)-binding domain-containing protein [Kineococcus vitellinus]NAZ75979.1 NAD(P)-binding domain-containing protein [Kineococcus vitellinus]
MSTIGIIGSGNIGSVLAQLSVDAGHDVVIANSRGPQSLADLVGRLGERARAGTVAEAAAAGDLVVVTIPLGRVQDLPADLLDGKVVVDTCNYYPERDGDTAVLDSHELTTSELVQRHFAGARVVKAFNNIFAQNLGELQRPAGAADRTTLVIAGDDDAAEQAVAEFIDSIGYDVFDIGGLADSWRVQRDQPGYAPAYTVSGDPAEPRRLTREDLERLLEQADRSVR